MKKLYVNFERQGSINEFLLKFFSLDNKQQVGSHAQPTYSDSSCLREHCGAGRMRSFDDMLRLVKTYYPSTTDKILMDKLLKLTLNRELPDQYKNNKFYTDNKIKTMVQLASCSTMQKIRLIYNSAAINSSNNPFTVKKYKSKKSWEELLKPLGISNHIEYKQYLEKHTNTLNTKAVV